MCWNSVEKWENVVNSRVDFQSTGIKKKKTVPSWVENGRATKSKVIRFYMQLVMAQIHRSVDGNKSYILFWNITNFKE